MRSERASLWTTVRISKNINKDGNREVAVGCGVSDKIPDAVGAASSRSMTARPDGAAGEGEEDSLFDEPIEGEELEGFMGEPPEVALALIKEHAIYHPETIRGFVTDTLRRLAMESGCVHQAPLVTWKDDKTAAETCGNHQARLLGEFGLQVIIWHHSIQTMHHVVLYPQRV